MLSGFMIRDQECLIVVGGSQSHVPFIEAAQNLGYQTVVFDRDQNSKGAEISDRFCKISTHDIDQIISKCCEINDEMKLVGVMTYSSSTEPLFAVARTCEILGLPSFSSGAVELATNKKLMKKCFTDSSIATPDWIVTDKINEAIDYIKSLNGQVIIKPSYGSQGSKGVLLFDQEFDISKQFYIAKENSNDSNVILEEYYTGREFSVDGIVVGDKPVILSVSEKFNLGPEFNFTMCGFSMGIIANDDRELQGKLASIKAAGKQAAIALGISNSFFSVDILLTNDEPLILECGILLDCKIDRLLRAAGINVYELFIYMIAGRNIVVKEPEHTKGYGLSFMFADQEGRLSLNTDNQLIDSLSVEWERKQGDPVSPPESIADTLGWIIACGNDTNAAYKDACETTRSELFRVIA